MLGKRFRRTTSMSQFGPGSLIKGPAGDSGPDAAMQAAYNLPDLQYKSARPLIVQAHVCAGNGDPPETGPGDGAHSAGSVQPLGGIGVGVVQAQRPASMEEGCAVDAICEEMSIEGVGSKPDQGNAAAVPFFDSSAVIGRRFAHCFEAIAGAAEVGYGSPMAYQTGLWAQSSFPTGQGSAKREQISPVGFLDVCFYCKRRLRHERDIFMYRGDTAFCSEECRHRQMVNDERKLARLSSGKRGGGGGTRARSETAVAA